MDRNEVQKTVIKMLEMVIGSPIEEGSGDLSLMEDINISSLEIMTLIADLEGEFNMRFDEEDIRRMVKINDIVDYIMEKCN